MNLPILVLASLAALGVLSVSGDDFAPSAVSSAPAMAVPDPSPQQGQQAFTVRSLRGPHGFSYSGSHQTLGQIASSGLIRFDGHGNARADYTTSVGGTTFTGTFLGTYTVNPEGTGSLVVYLPWLNLQAHGNFVLVDHGDGTFFSSTDAGYSVTGSTRRV